MSIKKSALVATALGMFGGSYRLDAHASSSAARTCVFDKYAPVAIQSYSGTDVSSDWGSFSLVGGAQLFVPAREGLTKEFLKLSVQHALVGAQNADSAMKAPCGLPSLKNVHVNVVSAGNGYWVQLLGADEETADALLKWAHARVAPRAPSLKIVR